jgi:hypothetical protein
MTDLTPNLTLAGQSWPVSFFVLGEQKIVVPLIYQAQAELRANGITAKYYELLFDLMVFVIKRAEADFDRTQLESLASGLPELQAAFLVICQQAGMTTGEAKAS